MAGGDRLSDLPDSILLHILSNLEDSKAVVRTSVLSTRWQFIWKSVLLSLDFNLPNCSSEKNIADFLASTNRELYYWRSCEKIQRFRCFLSRYDQNYVKDVDLWVHFAIKVANVENLTLGFHLDGHPNYEFPQFAHSSRNISPHVKYFELLGLCDKICLKQRNVASFVSADLFLEFDDLVDEERDLEEECSYFEELLHSVAHVEQLELGPWCIQCLSLLDLKGWQSPPSSRKFLKLNTSLGLSDFPGICRFLQSSLNLETLVIDWYNYGSRSFCCCCSCGKKMFNKAYCSPSWEEIKDQLMGEATLSERWSPSWEEIKDQLMGEATLSEEWSIDHLLWKIYTVNCCQCTRMRMKRGGGLRHIILTVHCCISRPSSSSTFMDH
ncbi:F-box/LRR-repeat protein At3g03360-like [Nicotiana tomentosiformis]|uniref:F-box/LRR-repeat protein At3g03360-like n=1 Tax=Nicotiana tomentosiformis TaxID=4098 RepID=UPI00388CBFEB